MPQTKNNKDISKTSSVSSNDDFDIKKLEEEIKKLEDNIDKKVKKITSKLKEVDSPTKTQKKDSESNNNMENLKKSKQNKEILNLKETKSLDSDSENLSVLPTVLGEKDECENKDLKKDVRDEKTELVEADEVDFSNRKNKFHKKKNKKQIDYDPSKVERIVGILDTSRDGHGVVRYTYGEHKKDTYISVSQVKRFNLKAGDIIEGPIRPPKDNERYWGLLKVEKVNGIPVEEFVKKPRVDFKSLVPVYPNKRIKLEIGKIPVSLRIIDLIAPIGRGQRSLIVSPPKAGKTTLLKYIATGIAQNEPDIHLMAVLVGERPEEVTDIKRHIDKITNGKGEVAASNFDESAQQQCQVAELALERAKRMVEEGRHVVILLDSITRLARAYNLAMPTSGRTLSGGFDPVALFPPKRFFGTARNFENGGSLTIIGTALVETGSRMDDLIYEEFKGTGNQEIHLDRRLAERRIFPAINVQKSGTRKDELLYDPMTYQEITTLHRMLDTLSEDERTSILIDQIKKTNTNKEFLASLKG